MTAGAPGAGGGVGAGGDESNRCIELSGSTDWMDGLYTDPRVVGVTDRGVGPLHSGRPYRRTIEANCSIDWSWLAGPQTVQEVAILGFDCPLRGGFLGALRQRLRID